MSPGLSDYGKVQRLELEPREADLFVCVSAVSLRHFEALKERREEFLSPGELQYFNQRQFERKQRSYLSGRYAAKLALREFVPLSQWQAIDIYPGAFEQPLVRCSSTFNPCVSISHCDDIAMAIAFPPTHPMGIDIEKIEAEMTPTMKSQMTAAEQAWTQPDEDRRCALIWTAKEALAKAIKSGLTTSFELLEVEGLKSNEPNHWHGAYRHFKQFHCVSRVTDRHALSIALPIQVGLPAQPDPGALI